MSKSSPKRSAHVLEDPSAVAVARVYAKAFLNAAIASKCEDAALVELEEFVTEVLDQNAEFGELLSSPLTSAADKAGIVERVVGPRGSEFITNFFRVLARHDRLNLLPLIANVARQMHQTQHNQQKVYVKSALALSSQQQQEVSDRLKALFAFEPILETTVEADLLGGLVIQVGDTVYDSSLRTRIRTLRSRLRERYLNEIQSGRDRFRHPEGN